MKTNIFYMKNRKYTFKTKINKIYLVIKFNLT